MGERKAAWQLQSLQRQLPAGRTLPHLDNCNKKAVILTEGGFDVLRFGDNAICSFGIELTLVFFKNKAKESHVLTFI